MGTKLQARILHALAKTDCFSGVGRLFIGEARISLGRSDLTAENITELWREYYPAEAAVEAQPNLILIYFDGKPEPRRSRRPNAKVVAGISTELYPADKSNHFAAAEPERYEGDCIKAENPEDRIIL